MNRAPLDLRYDHEMRIVPADLTISSQPRFRTQGLVARLRGLEALMDAERGHVAAWIAARPNIVLS